MQAKFLDAGAFIINTDQITRIQKLSDGGLKIAFTDGDAIGVEAALTSKVLANINAQKVDG